MPQMKSVRSCHVVLVTLGACALATPLAVDAANPVQALTLSSTEFAAGSRIPETFVMNAYGCKGGNVSPALSWRGVPAGTKSFALTLYDPDEKGSPSGWWHWVVYNIPATVTALPRGAGAENGKLLPKGAEQGRSDLGTMAYHGPCPDVGQAPHHYTFTVYALNVEKLDVPPQSSGAMVSYTALGATLAKSTLVGMYGR